MVYDYNFLNKTSGVTGLITPFLDNSNVLETMWMVWAAGWLLFVIFIAIVLICILFTMCTIVHFGSIIRESLAEKNKVE
jgi:hypothetical protein